MSMGWNGDRLKGLAKEKGISLVNLASSLEVTRQSINDWIRGAVPKGTHLMALSRVFGVSPNFFFSDDLPRAISVPLHRLRGVAKLTQERQEKATRLAAEYEKFFRAAPDPGLVPVLRTDMGVGSAANIAEQLRRQSGIPETTPMDYRHTFGLLAKLEIVTIFRDFPRDLKDYAFYCRVHNHRVIFVNAQTNTLDLIFPLLHETIHAIRDEGRIDVKVTEEEEFCDEVASRIQFPEEYVASIYEVIRGRSKAIQVNLLKEKCKTNGHSLFGIAKQLESRYPGLSWNPSSIGGADTNIKKEFPRIRDILYGHGDVGAYVKILRTFSPKFFDLVAMQMRDVSTRKLGEWFGLDTSLDAREVRRQIEKLS
jgi:transcriptional regulator with XRE-family HTH domain